MYDQIAANKRNSFIIVAFFFLLVALLGYFLGVLFSTPLTGLVFGLVFSLFFFLLQYYNGDKLILKVVGARPANPRNPKELYLINTVEGLAIAAGIPTPKVFVIKDDAINAFATGRNPANASVAVTTGALEKLDRLELEGVIAHEISHIKNYDVLFMLLTVTLIGVTIMLSDFLRRLAFYGDHDSDNGLLLLVAVVFSLLAPLAAYLMHFALSRQREFLADANGALLTRYPEGLASALEKILEDEKKGKDVVVDSVEVNRAVAPLFFSNPLKRRGFVSNLFSTHPPLEERIKRLRGVNI